jgi:hypothetical protein
MTPWNTRARGLLMIVGHQNLNARPPSTARGVPGVK